MKLESLVIVDQHATVNLYLGLVLPARHTLEVPEVRKLCHPVHPNGLFTFVESVVPFGNLGRSPRSLE